MLKMTFPSEWGVDKCEEMLALTKDICSYFPFQSGSAGFVFECSPYEEEESQTHAWKMSMRHRGIDISRIPEDASAVGQDAVKGVNWLTILGETFVKKLGGSQRIKKVLSREVEMIDAAKGIILKAGPAPAIGDVNRRDYLPAYQEVYRLVEPLMQPAIERSLAFNLAGEDDEEMTERWFKRFASE